MLSLSIVASVLSMAALTSAQAGRYPCSSLVNGVLVANASMCNLLVATGGNIGDNSTAGGFQSDGFVPVGSSCVQDPASLFFFCGYTGAPCNPANIGNLTACDNGQCVATNVSDPTVGTCQGSITSPCNGDDDHCLGLVYCTNSNGLPTTANTCGGIGSFCQDPAVGVDLPTDAQIQVTYNSVCASGYCNAGTSECDLPVPLGGDCSTDPQFGCVNGTVCAFNVTTSAQTCLPPPVVTPSGHARARRNQLYYEKRSRICPLSRTACSVPGSGNGYECIDTESNLEQCGACASEGGLDCTSISGVDAVGCVFGQCEIWACAAGYVYNRETSSCVVSFVA